MNRPFINAVLDEIDPLEVLYDLDGYYSCPKDGDKRLGPLVGYAGRDDLGRQYVGDIYANLAKAEQWPWVYNAWMMKVKPALRGHQVDTYVGMPMGGILVSADLARTMEARRIYAEKEVLELKTATSREKTRLVMGRHDEIEKGERLAICEDVVNNLSTAKEAIELYESQGGVVVAIITLLNRSSAIDYNHNGRLIPIVAMVHKPMPQYRQDDEEVVADIAAGNVVLKPKSKWIDLKFIMGEHRK